MGRLAFNKRLAIIIAGGVDPAVAAKTLGGDLYAIIRDQEINLQFLLRENTRLRAQRDWVFNLRQRDIDKAAGGEAMDDDEDQGDSE